MDLKTLFKQKEQAIEQPQVNSQPLNTQSLNPDARKDRETYNQWGSRMCGKVAASTIALPAYLQSVFYDIKKMQAQNEALQQELKQGIQDKVTKNKADQADILSKIQECEDKMKAYTGDLEEYKKQKQKIEESKEEVNKEERLKMIIGLCIIVPLTIYLFIFYSSAFYSAFFKDFQQVVGLASAIFDANAIPNAVKDGFMEATFILFAPIIFLGLGFILHFIMKQTGAGKFFKSGVIILVTLTFDVIIAYQIGKHIYDNWALSQLSELPPFSMSMSVKDPNFWAVIFCGFIAYIIWGLVFNLVMSAYNNLDLTKSKLKNIALEILDLKDKMAQNNSHKQSLNTNLNKLKVDEQQLLSQLGNFVIYNIADIKMEMNNFYTGWLQNMSAQGCSNELQKEAASIYTTAMNTLFQ